MRTYPTKLLFLLGALAVSASAAELHIGAASVDITPDKPAALNGQFKTRISQNVQSPLAASAVAIEAYEGGKTGDQAILLSCDILGFRPKMSEALRARLREKLPGFDPRKLVMTATHTHSAPVTESGFYAIPAEGVVQPEAYAAFLVDRLADLCTNAWHQRKPGRVSWGLGHAAIGVNRRAVFSDGGAAMYGDPASPDFTHIEGEGDDGLELLFFWDHPTQLLATAINVACPAQVLEHNRSISADFWHDVRGQLPKGVVLGWPGACGDLAPHWMYRKAAEARMLRLRSLSYTAEIGRRLAREVNDVRELTRNDIRTDVPFAHRVETITLPGREVTEQDAEAAKKALAALLQKKPGSLQGGTFQRTIDRFNKREAAQPLSVEVHVLRIGDIAIATNPFELYHDYGLQMKARSKAVQTFVLELTDGWHYYLPTPRAVAAGGYSALAENNRVGPEGGKILVDRTVGLINALWPETNAPASR
jgi:hypothetical protein